MWTLWQHRCVFFYPTSNADVCLCWSFSNADVCLCWSFALILGELMLGNVDFARWTVFVSRVCLKWDCNRCCSRLVDVCLLLVIMISCFHHAHVMDSFKEENRGVHVFEVFSIWSLVLWRYDSGVEIEYQAIYSSMVKIFQ